MDGEGFLQVKVIGFQGWGLAKLTSGVVTPVGPGGEEVSERRLARPHTLARSFIKRISAHRVGRIPVI